MKKSAQQVINDTNAWLEKLAETKALQGPPVYWIEPMSLIHILRNLMRKRAEGWPTGRSSSGKSSGSSEFEPPKTKPRKAAP